MFKLIGVLFVVLCNLTFADKLHVESSFSILADIVQNIGGDKIVVDSVVKANQDAHSYEVKPSDIVKINKSKILFINGLGLESGWLMNLTKSYKGEVVTAANGFSSPDPHIWHNPLLVVKYYIPNIVAALVKADPTNTSTYKNNAKEYKQKLLDLNSWVIKELALTPERNRQAVTTHDAFSYFAKQYHIKFLHIKGVSTDADASVRDIVKLTQAIKKSKVKVVFLENMTNNKLINQVAHDTHASFGDTLYADALGNGANNYINLIKLNTNTLVKAWTK